MSTTELPTLPEHRSKAALAATEREALAAGRREETRRCIELAAVARFYLVQQPGPTLFMLKEDGSETTYKIAIGEQKCSCMRRPALCIHVVGTRRVILCWLLFPIEFQYCLCVYLQLQHYVMIKIFRVPTTSPLLFQATLSEYDLSQILEFRSSNHNRRRASHRPADGDGNGAQKEVEVAPKPLEDDECWYGLDQYPIVLLVCRPWLNQTIIFHQKLQVPLPPQSDLPGRNDCARELDILSPWMRQPHPRAVHGGVG